MHIRSFDRGPVVVAVLAVTLTLATMASARLNKSGGATAAFKVGGPAGMSIEGKTSSVSVTEDANVLVVVVALPSLTTGIGLRDKHMRDDLEADRYPTAELRVGRSALRVPAAGAEASGDARASLRLHGQAKDITIHYRARREGDVIAVHGTARIDMTDFGIKTPSYLGVGVKRDVDITADFGAKDE